jgi:hypothetical protein
MKNMEVWWLNVQRLGDNIKQDLREKGYKDVKQNELFQNLIQWLGFWEQQLKSTKITL